MHRAHLLIIRTRNMNIQTLTLINKRSSTNSEVQNSLLTYFPDCTINPLHRLRNSLNLLNRPIISHNLLSNLISPKIQSYQVIYQMSINTDKFSTKSSSGVNITSKSLKGFIITQNLAGARCWHRTYQK